MGTDKALLQMGGRTLLEHVAAIVSAVSGSVKLVGSPERYGGFGIEVVSDRFADCGPLAGIEAALADSKAERTLITACDLPCITVALLEKLFQRAEDSKVEWVLPVGEAGWDEPLCAVYGREAHEAARVALEQRRYKVTSAFAHLSTLRLRPEDAGVLTNTNTPEEWAAAGKGRELSRG
jgi:molybdopterin-guanine dinucleotide biosynthesis protein A